MNTEVMDLEQVARYLSRDLREVTRLANRGYLPGRKVSGEWKFSRAEITHWVENQMHAYTEQELASLEGVAPGGEGDLLIDQMLLQASIAAPLPARTRSSVLRELVALAENSGQVYNPNAILAALEQREALSSTALENGVAIPHPRRPLPNALGEAIIALGRTTTGIPFGAPHGGLTDLFFLVCCRDDRTHLQVLARLSRLFLRPGLLDELRTAETPIEIHQRITAVERELIGVD
jgi:PTS system nitrogen regulatory IIA component